MKFQNIIKVWLERGFFHEDACFLTQSSHFTPRPTFLGVQVVYFSLISLFARKSQKVSENTGKKSEKYEKIQILKSMGFVPI